MRRLKEALPERALSTASAVQVVRLLNALPHGVHGMSPRVDGLVETSCNLAIVRIKKDALEVISSQRSSSMSRLDEMTTRVAAVAALAGASATRLNHHPAWAPDMAAALLQALSQGLWGVVRQGAGGGSHPRRSGVRTDRR